MGESGLNLTRGEIEGECPSTLKTPPTEGSYPSIRAFEQYGLFEFPVALLGFPMADSTGKYTRYLAFKDHVIKESERLKVRPEALVRVVMDRDEHNLFAWKEFNDFAYQYIAEIKAQ